MSANGNSVADGIAAYVAETQRQTNDYFAREFPTLEVPEIAVEQGVKFARIVTRDRSGNGSVHSFVDLATGDILKADSYRRPAKGVRGSVFRLADGGFDHRSAAYRR